MKQLAIARTDIKAHNISLMWSVNHKGQVIIFGSRDFGIVATIDGQLHGANINLRFKENASVWGRKHVAQFIADTVTDEGLAAAVWFPLFKTYEAAKNHTTK